MALSKLSEKCIACPENEKCEYKYMELVACAKLPKLPKGQIAAGINQSIAESMAMPLTRERIESPLSPLLYKDEIENALRNNYRMQFLLEG